MRSPGSASLDTDTHTQIHSEKRAPARQRHTRAHRPTNARPCAPTRDIHVRDDPGEPQQPSTPHSPGAGAHASRLRAPTSREGPGPARATAWPPLRSVHGRARGTDGSGSCVGRAEGRVRLSRLCQSSCRQKSDAGNKSQARVARPARPSSI